MLTSSYENTPTCSLTMKVSPQLKAAHSPHSPPCSFPPISDCAPQTTVQLYTDRIILHTSFQQTSVLCWCLHKILQIVKHAIYITQHIQYMYSADKELIQTLFLVWRKYQNSWYFHSFVEIGWLLSSQPAESFTLTQNITTSKSVVFPWQETEVDCGPSEAVGLAGCGLAIM